MTPKTAGGIGWRVEAYASVNGKRDTVLFIGTEDSCRRFFAHATPPEGFLRLALVYKREVVESKGVPPRLRGV